MQEDTFLLILLLGLVFPYFLLETLIKGPEKPFSMEKFNILNEKLNIVGKIIMTPVYILNFMRYIGSKFPMPVKKVIVKLFIKKRYE